MKMDRIGTGICKKAKKYLKLQLTEKKAASIIGDENDISTQLNIHLEDQIHEN